MRTSQEAGKKVAATTDRCSSCAVGRLCVAAGSDNETLRQLDAVLAIREALPAQSDVIQRGDTFNALYAVHSGCFKSYLLDCDGNEQVQGFHFPGELIGLDAIDERRFRANVTAMGDASLCELDYDALLRLSACSDGLRKQLFRLFSSKLAGQQWRALDFTADERIAAFLLDIAERFRQRGHSAFEFELAMSRSDIGNYLALATETVSRVVSRFKKSGLIDVDRKRVRLLEIDALQKIAQPVFDVS